MKSIIVIYIFISCYSYIEAIRFGRVLPPKVESLAGVETKYFNQILDHYASTKTYWNQRYFINDEYWGGGNSPVFLMVGGESEASPSWMKGGAWVTWAAKYKALLFQLEHRFYGQSHPTADVSTANLKYLTSQQALGDIAYFIYETNKANNFTTRNKWILFGGSYPGNLVAWARLKYPQIVFGSISSSGPLKAEANFTQYNDVVRDSLNSVSQGCAGELTKAIKSIQNMFTSNQGLSTLKSKFSICQGFNSKIAYDKVTLVQSLTGGIARAVQYNNQLSDTSISKVCSYLNNKSVPDPVDRLSQLYKATSSGCVYASYAGTVFYYKQTNWTSNPVSSGNRQWLFQTCNEFGYYQTSGTTNSLLSDAIPIGYFTQLCTDIFGTNYNANQLNNAVANTNRFYGGTAIQVQRVVFLQGSIDPWHALGMVERPTQEDPFVYITGTSHCYDMLSPQTNDPPSLTSARNTADQYINYWMGL